MRKNKSRAEASFERSILNTRATLKEKTADAIEKLIVGRPKTKIFWELIKNEYTDVSALAATCNDLRELKNFLMHSFVREKTMTEVRTEDDVYLVILATGLLRNFGNWLVRENHKSVHQEYSCTPNLLLAQPILDRMLLEVYKNSKERYQIRDTILNRISVSSGEKSQNRSV